MKSIHIKMNNSEKLFDVIYRFFYQAEVKKENVKWKKIPAELKKVLDACMNSGIPREDAVYILCRINDKVLCLADYGDAENNFAAHYLVYNNEVIYSLEN